MIGKNIQILLNHLNHSFKNKFLSMYFHQKSNKAARFALGSSIELMDNIMNDKIQNGFAIM